MGDIVAAGCLFWCQLFMAEEPSKWNSGKKAEKNDVEAFLCGSTGGGAKQELDDNLKGKIRNGEEVKTTER
jgi:hypothetical protein